MDISLTQLTDLSVLITKAQLSMKKIAKFYEPVCKILPLTAAKSSKFRGSPWPSICK